MLVNPAILNFNHKPLNSKQPKIVAFTGDVLALQPYFNTGLTNKTLGDKFCAKRPDIDVNKIYQQLIEPANTKHLLITGESSSGKSVLASTLAHKLKKENYKVFCVENNFYESILDSKKFDELTNSIKALNTDQRVFIFIDEPHLILKNELKNANNDQKQGVFNKLALFLEQNPHVKLISIMLEDGVDYIINNVEPNTSKFLFNERINVSAIDNNTVIDMTNKVLNSVGFKDMPQHIADLIRTYPNAIDPREIIYGIVNQVDQGNRINDINTMEEIKGNVWEDIITWFIK